MVEFFYIWLAIYVLPLHFIAREQFMSQKACAAEGLSLTRPLDFDNKRLDIMIH